MGLSRRVWMHLRTYGFSNGINLDGRGNLGDSGSLGIATTSTGVAELGAPTFALLESSSSIVPFLLRAWSPFESISITLASISAMKKRV